MSPEPTTPLNPFPGLRPFQVEEEYLFFGREAQCKELIALLRQHRFLAVLGASGSGKSSLVRAGLLPGLLGGVMTQAGSHWNIAIMRPGASPVRNLARALLEGDLCAGDNQPTLLEMETTLWRSGLGLVEAARQARMPASENLLVVVDQFEELFRFSQSQPEGSTRDEAAAFVRLLLETAAQESLSIYVVLTMRSDFFGDCSQFDDLAEAINKGEYLVPRLNRDQKKQAIEGPIRVGGATITPRLVQRLLSDVGDDPDQLPIMQHALMRTWDAWAADRGRDEGVDLRHYEGIGGMREALSRHSEEVFASLPDERHRIIAERVFKALTERGSDNRGVRRPTRLGMLAEIASGTPGEVCTVVETFRAQGRTFLMPPEPVELGPETVIDISHESLMRVWQRLRHWVEEEAQSARIYGRLAETAALYADGKAGLYRDPDLQIALAWQATVEPSDAWGRRYHAGFTPAIQFLEKSAEAQRQEKDAQETARQRELEQARALATAEHNRAEEQVRFTRRLKWLVRGLGLVAMVAVAAFALALIARSDARRQAQMAETNRAEAQRNAERARRQARLAEEQKSTADQLRSESQQLAEKMKTTLTRADFVAGTEQIQAGKIGRALSFLARSMRTDPTYAPAAFFTKQVLLEHTIPLVPPTVIAGPKPFRSWAVNEKRDAVFVTDIDSYGSLWNANTALKLGGVPEGAQVSKGQFSRDGNLLFTATSPDSEIRGWDVHNGKEVTPPLRAGYGMKDFQVSSATSRGYLVAAQNADGSLQLWDSSKGEAIGTPLKTSGKALRYGFSPDGKWLFGDFDDRKLGVWTAEDGKPVGELVGHDFDVASASFTPNSRFLMLVGGAARRLLWVEPGVVGLSPRNAQLDQSIRESWFDASGGRVMAVGWDSEQGRARLQIRSFDLATATELARVDEPEFTAPIEQGQNRAPGSLPRLYFVSPDRERGTLGGWMVGAVVGERKMRFWEMSSGKLISEIPSQEAPVELAGLSPDGGRVALVLANRQARSYDLFTAKPLGNPVTLGGETSLVSFNETGETIFVYTSEGGTAVYPLDGRNGQMLSEPRKLSSGFFVLSKSALDRNLNLFFARGVTQSGDGRVVLTEGEVVAWRHDIGQRLPATISIPGKLRAATFSPDSRTVLVASEDPSGGYAYLLDARSGQLEAKLRHPQPLNFCEFSSDGRRFLTAGEDHVLRIWDRGTQEPSLKLPHPKSLSRAHFSPDGKHVLVVMEQGMIQAWDALNGSPLFDAVEVGSAVYDATFSPDGKTFVVAAESPSFQILQTLTGKASVPPLESDRNAYKADFSPDGQVLFGVGFQGSLSAWEASTGKLLQKMGSGMPFQAVVAHPSGKLVATGSGGSDEEEGAVLIWDWRSGKLATESMGIPGRPYWTVLSREGTRVAALGRGGMLKVWDVATGRTLITRPERGAYGSALEFGPDGRQLLACFYSPGQVELIDVAPVGTNAPAWLPPLAEAVGGKRFNEAGALESVPVESLSILSRQFTNSEDQNFQWASWLFADRERRPAAPGAASSVVDYALKLTSDPNTLSNRFKALQLAPNDGRIYARIGLEMLSATNRDHFDAPLSNHWNASALWYADQATNLAPAVAEVWGLRAAVLSLIGRVEEAVTAGEFAVKLDPKDPNAWYGKALSLQVTDRKEEAYQAFEHAFGALPKRDSDLRWNNLPVRPYLPKIFRDWMQQDRQLPTQLAQLGRQRLDEEESGMAKYWEASWATRKATELLPQDPLVWIQRAECLLAADEEDRAYDCLLKGVDLDSHGKPDPQQYGNWIRQRIYALDRQGRYAESRSFALRRGIPPRDPAVSAAQIDLGPHYNASLWEHVHRSKGRPADAGRWWDKLPKGLVTLAGVAFDLRGEVHLSGSALAQGRDSKGGEYAVRFPEQVLGIRVGAKAQWLHMLHTAGWGGSLKPGTIIGRYRLHYADEKTHDFPIVVGVNVDEWLGNPFGRLPRAQRAWAEFGGSAYNTLYKTCWENPRPEVEITTIDLISDMTLGAPNIFAITLENQKTDTQLEAASSTELIKEALVRLKETQGVEQSGKAYAGRIAKLAGKKTPQDVKVRCAEAEVLSLAGELKEAQPLIESLLADQSQDPEAWNAKATWLARSGDTEGCVAASRRAVELADWSSEPGSAARERFILTASDELESRGRMGEAREFRVKASVPPRTAVAQVGQVDLAQYYNGSMDESWFRTINGADPGPMLKSFPRGLVTFQGITFDARGVIHLNHRYRQVRHPYPNQVTGIKVGARGDQVHFLHATSWNDRFGTIVARYQIHYADGRTNEFPVASGPDIRDFYLDKFDVPEANLVWRARGITGRKGDVGLFLSSWDNPYPETEITSIDLVSTLTEAQPFVLGITVEKFKAEGELDACSPRQLAETAVYKINPQLHPGTRTKEYATRLSEKALKSGAGDADVLRLRAEFLRRAGDEKGALEAADKALALKQSSKTWSLKAGLLTSAGRSEEAAAATRQKRIQEIKERLPERDPSATAALVDLGPYYNLVVSEPLHPLAGFSADGAENLSQLKPGVQPLSGVPFDVRGLIHLQGANSQMSVLQRSYERACKGIKVGAKANKLHFLHGLGWVRNDPAGTVVGTFVIHYVDGQTVDVPVRLVEDGFDWHLSNWRRNSPSGTDSKLAWRGASGIGQEVELGVYLKTWSNPRPDVEISTLDFISAMNDANPFLLALTLE